MCYMCTKSFQLYLTFCYCMDCSLPGSSVHGDSPGQNTGLGCHVLLLGIFPTQGWNPRLFFLTCIGGLVLYHWHHLGSPYHALLSFKISIPYKCQLLTVVTGTRLKADGTRRLEHTTYTCMLQLLEMNCEESVFTFHSRACLFQWEQNQSAFSQLWKTSHRNLSYSAPYFSDVLRMAQNIVQNGTWSACQSTTFQI